MICLQLRDGLQMNGAWQVHNAGLAPLHKQASAMRQQFDTFILDHIYRRGLPYPGFSINCLYSKNPFNSCGLMIFWLSL